MKNLISISDITAAQAEALFDLAREVKDRPDVYHDLLSGKKLGLIFEKPSTRTWVSFDAGVFSLGGGTIYLGPDDIKLGLREEIKDVARVLGRYLAGVVMRTFSHQTIVEFSKYFDRPVINGLSDSEHPCQALADFFTIQEKFKGDKNPVIGYVGDGNNVLSSLILLSAKMGRDIRFATPKQHAPKKALLDQAKKVAKKTGATIEGFNDPKKAVDGVDVVYTDVWVSMGEEKVRKQKLKNFKGMQVNKQLLKRANKNAVVMHCLPAHRGQEITDDVLESKKAIIFDQAENRLHIQKAILIQLFG